MESELLDYLGNERVESRETSHDGVPSEHTAGLPLWKRVLDLALIVRVDRNGIRCWVGSWSSRAWSGAA